ncbi:Zinc finger, CCHC-type superfamily [Sesbania bispinosa]|nr:Zinc finger, CCHC-type superfamily [Sesbania bispinosa]
MTPTLNLGHAYHFVAEDEQQPLISTMHKPVTEAVAFQAQSTRYKDGAERKGSKKEKPKCEHCQKVGHTKDECYEIIGYPPDWRRSRRDEREKTGSWSDKKNGSKVAQLVTEGSPIPGLSMQQYERLMQQLKIDAEPVVGTRLSVNIAGNQYKFLMAQM